MGSKFKHPLVLIGVRGGVCEVINTAAVEHGIVEVRDFDEAPPPANFTDADTIRADKALDRAVEAFSERVAWEEEPEDNEAPEPEKRAAPGDAMASIHPSPTSAWRPFDSAPRDGTYIIAAVGLISESRWAHLAGRCFVVRHMTYGDWALYPGMSVGDDWFTHWMPLPEAPK